MSKNYTPLCPCIICADNCRICNPLPLPEGYEALPIIEHKLIESEHDILSLDIIDWNRLNGYWNNPGEALRTIAGWLINLSHYAIIEIDLYNAPQRDDFPGWEHAGDHERIGRLYWNWFHRHRNGKLIFSDSPDFYGTLYGGKRPFHFHGDIGKVSASAFAMTEKRLGLGDIWISIVDTKRQIIIEPFADLRQIWGDVVRGKDPWERYKMACSDSLEL